MTTGSWNCLPVLPLRNILEYLDLEDALAATATCRNWRNAIFMYNGHRETLTLRVNDIEKTQFLTKLFRKHTRRLHVYVDGCEDDLDNFIQHILPKFYDMALVYEIVFIGPRYEEINGHTPIVKMRSRVTENIISAHLDTLKTLAFLGCANTLVDDGSEYGGLNASGLPFISSMLPESPLLFNCSLKAFTSLQHVCTDYDTLDAEALESLSRLPRLSRLSLCLRRSRRYVYGPLPWGALDSCCAAPVQLVLNIIGLPTDMFEEVMEHVLVEDMPLVAIRVLFCRTIHYPLIGLLSRNYRSTLREVQWIDSQLDNVTVPLELQNHINRESCGIHPLILLCWQCSLLEKLVVHGYWIWQYDLLGMARLRAGSLRHLEVSATYGKPSGLRDEGMAPVRCGDRARHVDRFFVQEMNDYLPFRWNPVKKWSSLHPALGPKATDNDRTDYVMKEILKPLGVT